MGCATPASPRAYIGPVHREAKLDVPEFRIDTTSIKLHLPDLRMVTQTWKFDLPSITLKDVKVELRKTENQSSELQRAAKDRRRLIRRTLMLWL